MPQSKDPDTLRIPAFMRKRSISTRLKKPLVLTALDRKKAGILPEGLQKKKRVVRKSPLQRSSRRVRDSEMPTEVVLPFYNEVETPARRTRTPRAAKTRRSPTRRSAARTTPSFEAPIISSPVGPTFVGTVTHYYNKINVAVIKLADTLSVGDCITYYTPAGPYEQAVESIEIDRVPVFSAHKGQEIGIKLKKEPRPDSPVMK